MINLTEAATFDTPITVPEGTDTHGLAAENVQDIAQRLANRTKYLRDRADNAAQLDEANEFTVTPQFITSTNNGISLIESTKTSLDDPDVTGAPGNAWKLHLNFKADALRHVRLYVGSNDPTGSMAWTVNAFWHKADGKWRPDTNTKDSLAIFAVGETLNVRRQVAGTFDWTSWPADKGDIVLGGEVLYAAPKRRTTLLNLSEAQGAVLRLDTSGRVTFDTSAPAGSVEISFAVRLPVGSVIIGADLIVNKHDAANPPTAKWRARPAVPSDFTTPSSINMFTRDSKTGTGSTGLETLHLDPSAGGGGYFVDGTEEFQITFARGGGLTAVIDEVQAVRVIWDDYGLRNDW